MRTAIIARAEGVPLFIRSSCGHWPIGKPTSRDCPEQWHSYWLPELDDLGEARPLAQIAATIGREVPIDLLATLAAMPSEQFEEGLNRLISSGVMVHHGPAGNAVLAFQHALLGDAAYHGMQTGRRRDLHRRIAFALRGSDPAVLGRHYAAAGEHEQAAAAFRDAAEVGLAAGAFAEAEAHARQSIESIGRCAEERRAAVQLAALNLLGEALIATRGYADPEVQATFEEGARHYAQY